MKLNVGSGPHPAQGWVNVDSWPGTRPDLVADIQRLPFADGTVSHVYCGHVLEHLRLFTEVPRALAELRRVLQPDGQLCVVGPDAARALTNEEWHPLLPGIREGGRQWPGDEHRYVATGPVTLAAVRDLFPDAEEVDIAAVPDCWPVVDRVGWQFAITARRPNA